MLGWLVVIAVVLLGLVDGGLQGADPQLVELVALVDEPVLQELELAGVAMHLGGLEPEAVAVETAASQEDVELAEEERVIARHGQLNVALVARAELLVEAAGGTEVAQKGAEGEVVETARDWVTQVVQDGGVGNLHGREVPYVLGGHHAEVDRRDLRSNGLRDIHWSGGRGREGFS